MAEDSVLQHSVLAELEWDPSLTAAHIGVAANDGVVTLTGTVENFAQKHAAETAARRVRGVLGVAEELEVVLPFERKRSDSDIAAAALERLAWDVSIPADGVTVTVQHGWLTLHGEVHWHYQREAAEHYVRRLTGVIGVSNHITLRPSPDRNPTVDAASLADDIIHALHRSWFFDNNNIQVFADGGTVRLTGTVRSPHERQTAAATAWAAAGVVNVENDLTVL